MEHAPVTLQDPLLWKTASLVDGQWVTQAGPNAIVVRNPATGAALARVDDGGAALAERAVNAARTAFPLWAARPAAERGRLLRRWFELMVQHTADLANILTAEQGKPLTEARGEITYAASFVEWYAEEARRAYGDVVPAPSNNRRIVVLRQPLGVCAAITPWNFPAAMVTRKLAPALAAGNTVVLKPAEQTPLTALALGELALRAGIPAGVLNVVVGDPVAVGGVLTRHPHVAKVSFTGSTAVGRLIMEQCASTVKRLSLELGGNAPFIVLDDANVDAAVEGAVQSKFRNAGQTCVCANRIFVQDRIHDAFVEKLCARVAALRVGDGTEPGVEQGPLIDADALSKVEQHIADAVEKGARVAVGGKRHARGGTFHEPTVLTGVTARMRLMQEETFGPVAPVVRFTADADVVALANDTAFGLSGYVFGRDLTRVWKLAENLELGMVGINTGLISNEVSPFGGVKQSGFGREGGRWGMAEYLQEKYLCLGVE